MKQSEMLAFINDSRKGELARFFRASQYINLSHWGKNVWARILQISLFGEIAENVAVGVFRIEMIGPCTIAIVHSGVHTFLVVADNVGVCKIDLANFNHLQLERLGGILNGRIYPQDIDPSDKVKARQELLQAEISAMDDGSPSFYLAGV